MPRIDPLQLLKCLSVLLTPDGGILSRDEVPRLVNLMTKFSKKLVSKCVYVLILKSTDTELVDMFMAEGGWTLIQTWLQDAVQTVNWDLVREILGLLLVTPVDVERLKLNILPKLIKSLSRREELEGVAQLSTKLVQQWLMIVKGTSAAQIQAQAQAQLQSVVENIDDSKPAQIISTPAPITTQTEAGADKKEQQIEYVNEDSSISTNTFYKTTGKDGKLVIRKLPSVEETQEAVADIKQDTSKELEKPKEEKKEDKNKSKSNTSKSSKSSSSRRSSSSKDKSKDRDGDKEKDKKKSSSSSRSSSSGSSKSKSSDKSKDKDRKDREKDKDKDRQKANGALKSSSSTSSRSSKDKKDTKDKDKEKQVEKDKEKQAEKDKEKQADKDKEKQTEKDKDTLAKLKPPTIDKLGRIPKKSSSAAIVEPTKEDKINKEAVETKKKSFSIGVRKDRENEGRPKTVKVFNSKMRSTGLEEEIKPAPPRVPGKKPPSIVQLPTIASKRPSPPKDIREPIIPPEKKLKIDKIDVPDRPGAIKLIPPKPKPAFLLESDLFNEALTAATTKKEPKKRKRRLSVSKDGKDTTSPNTSPARDPPVTPTSPTTSNPTNNSTPLGLKNIAPINFYQDTLSEETEEEIKANDDNKENASENAEDKVVDPLSTEETKETPASPSTPTDDTKEDEPVEIKKPKLDGGLKGVLLYTKKKGPKRTISWKADTDLVEIRYFELDETERVNVTKTFGDMAKMEVSSEREALQHSRKVGGEDMMESQIMWRVPYITELDEPLAIPGHKSLEKDIQFAREKSVLQAFYFDKRRIPDSPEEPIPENHQMSDPVVIPLEDPESQEIDLRTTPWPEPKGLPPQPEPQPVPPMFPSIQAPFNPQFNNLPPPAFQGMPPRFPGPVGPMGPVGPGNFGPPNMIPNGNMMVPPNVGPAPHEMMNMNPNMFPPGPMPPDAFVPGPDFPMFPNQNGPNMNMFPPNNFNNHRQNNRGVFRRGSGGNSAGGWVRLSGSGGNNWKRGGPRGRLCKNVQIHGYCRNRDNCPFVHP